MLHICYKMLRIKLIQSKTIIKIIKQVITSFYFIIFLLETIEKMKYTKDKSESKHHLYFTWREKIVIQFKY